MAATIPSIWRPELLHPLTVHFPVALLLVGALLDLIAAFGTRARELFGRAALVMLAIGTATAWVAIYTGSIAEDIVNRVICDPTVTHRHEDFARNAAWIFTIALLLRFAQLRLSSRPGSMIPRALSVLTACAFLAAAGILGYAAHLGAELVYQQGAATYRPSASCEEFE